MRRGIVVFLLQFSLGLIVGCGSNTGPTAGGATDSPNALAGVLLDRNTGSPQQGVTVRLFKDIESDTAGVVSLTPGTIEPLDSSLTDSAGRYHFQITQRGVYAILAQTPNRTGVLHIDGIVVEENDVTLEPRKLKRSAAVRGQTTLPNGPRYTAVVQGTPIRKEVLPESEFILDGLYGDTAIVWVVLYYEHSGVTNVAALDTVVLVPGETVSVDTLSVRPVVPRSGRRLSEDGAAHFVGAELGGVWWYTKDSSAQNQPIHFRDSTAGYNGSGGVKLEYALAPEDSVGATLGVNMGSHFRPAGMPRGIKQIRDLSAVKSFRFRVRGTGSTLRIWFHSGLTGSWNDLVFTYTGLKEEWQLVTINLRNDLSQAFPTDDPRSWDDLARGLDAIMFSTRHESPREKAAIYLDDLELIY